MTGAQIGPVVIINMGCSIDHDCVLGEVVHINPGARLAGWVVARKDRGSATARAMSRQT